MILSCVNILNLPRRFEISPHTTDRSVGFVTFTGINGIVNFYKMYTSSMYVQSVTILSATSFDTRHVTNFENLHWDLQTSTSIFPQFGLFSKPTSKSSNPQVHLNGLHYDSKSPYTYQHNFHRGYAMHIFTILIVQSIFQGSNPKRFLDVEKFVIFYNSTKKMTRKIHISIIFLYDNVYFF